MTFQETIKYDLEYRISKKNHASYISYALLNEQEKQSEWETREIRKNHSKNVRFLQSMLTHITYWFTY